jgi:hypothetical protein
VILNVPRRGILDILSRYISQVALQLDVLTFTYGSGLTRYILKPCRIRDRASKCAEDDSYFEPLSDNYLVHFTRLMEVYQSKSEEDSHD